MNESYDVLVVGAGPAGSSAARAAARNGAEVLVVDKRRELGVPVQCGEALNEDILEELNIEPDPRWAINKVNGVRIVSPAGISFSLSEEVGGKVGYILDRKVFDQYLAILAARAGAEVRTCTFVDGLLTDDGKITGVTARSPEGKMEFRADVVVAADGVMSRVARWAGIDTTLKHSEIESGVQFKMVGIGIESPSVMEFYFGEKIAPGGYAWVFPRGEDTANVGLGVLAKRAKRPPIEYLRDFVEGRSELREGRIVELNGGGIPVSGPIGETVRENLLVVGDAARQVNPLTGGGMDSSMRAGNIAGEVAARVVAGGKVSQDVLKEYEELWREEMGEKFEKYLMGKEVLLELSDEELDDLARHLSKLDFEGVSLTDLLVALKSHPKLSEKLGGIL